MEFDTERLAKECEKTIHRMRIVMKGKGGPVIMTSLAFLVAEAINMTSDEANFEKNLRTFTASVQDIIDTARKIEDMNEGGVQ